MNLDPIHREISIFEARMGTCCNDLTHLISAIRSCQEAIGVLKTQVTQEDGMGAAPPVSPDPFGANLEFDYD